MISKVRRPSKVMLHAVCCNLLKRFKGVSILFRLKFKVSFAIKKTIYNVFSDRLYFIFSLKTIN